MASFSPMFPKDPNLLNETVFWYIIHQVVFNKSLKWEIHVIHFYMLQDTYGTPCTISGHRIGLD